MRLDYDRLAAEYAHHRRTHPDVLRSLIEGPPVTATARVLEVGCGTGNYLAALQAATGCATLGMDPSQQMLRTAARLVSSPCLWQGQAEALALRPATLDFVYSVDVIHHLRDRAVYFAQAYRALRPGGWLCTVTDSEPIIRTRRPLATHFPETVPTELRRYPRIAALRAMMHEHGFVDVNEKTVKFSYTTNDLRPYRDRAFSALHLIDETAFRRGLARLEREAERGPVQIVSRYVLLWGRK